jgi:formylglycine-generating enzyme required for sulfatase activity
LNRLRSIALFALVVGSLAPLRAAVADSPCFEDLDGNGQVGGGDISVMLLDFGPCPGCGADLDQDGEVSGSDLSLMLLSFGPCVEPSWATVLEWAPDPLVIYGETLRAQISATHWPWRVRDNGTGIEMVLIPPGEFSMGCTPSTGFACSSNESPVHSVALTQAFYMSRTEVTQGQWVAKMGSNPSNFQSASSAVPTSEVPNRPVEQVSYDDTQSFCTVTGLRLPTEAEWEYAYRSGLRTAFNSGLNDDNQLGMIAWFGGNSGNQTRPVAGKVANGFGLYDMSGNVFEWCQDWYADYVSGAQTNPTGAEFGSYRVLRGGGCNSISPYCRASYRGPDRPVARYFDLGFRVARTP